MYEELAKLKAKYPYDIEDWLRKEEVDLVPLEILLKFFKNIRKVI